MRRLLATSSVLFVSAALLTVPGITIASAAGHTRLIPSGDLPPPSHGVRS